MCQATSELCKSSCSSHGKKCGMKRTVIISEAQQMLDNMMDIFEENIKGRDLIFSQRHRLRWWTARGLKSWIKQNAPEKVEFT